MATIAEQKLMDLINHDNPNKDFSFANVYFDNIGVNTTAEPRDSMVQVVAVPGVEFRASKWVYYNRIDLGVVFSKSEVTVSNKSLPTGIVVLKDLVDPINRIYGTDFEASDFQPAVIDMSTLPVKVIMRPTVDNPAYQGSFEAWVYKDVPELSDVLISLDLLGFNYPETDNTKAQGLLYSYGVNGTSQASYLRNFTEGNSGEDDILALILNNWTRHNWLTTETASDFTLGGSLVAYNGKVVDCQLPISGKTDFSDVLVLNLSNKCLKVSGRITIWYNR